MNRVPVDAATLESDLAMNRQRRQTATVKSAYRLDAAVGIKNGLLGGIAFWAIGFALFSLGKALV